MTPTDKSGKPQPGKPQRPVVGSRNPTARPRKVASRTHVPEPPAVAADVPPVEEPQEAQEFRIDPTKDAEERSGMLARINTTIALVVALVLLTGVLVAEGTFLWASEEPLGDFGEVQVSSETPVVTGEMAHRSAVSAASEAAKEIVSIKYQDYDAEVEAAASKMTDSFAEQYRQTAEEIRAEFVAAEKEVEVQVVVSGVVRASSEQVEALVFLNQYVTTKGKDTTVTPYRTLVTVTDTDSGWLVSDIETK